MGRPVICFVAASLPGVLPRIGRRPRKAAQTPQVHARAKVMAVSLLVCLATRLDACFAADCSRKKCTLLV